MIKARAGRLILLGLSAKNIELLKDGRPILIDGADLLLQGLYISICYGETEEEIEKDLAKAGFVIPG